MLVPFFCAGKTCLPSSGAERMSSAVVFPDNCTTFGVGNDHSSEIADRAPELIGTTYTVPWARGKRDKLSCGPKECCLVVLHTLVKVRPVLSKTESLRRPRKQNIPSS